MGRLVISWFGWDLQQVELVPEEKLDAWIERVEELCERRYWGSRGWGIPST
jgi:hypothetical protein